jgi:energy-coupling factor transporter ATP-binding protein EcfA2
MIKYDLHLLGWHGFQQLCLTISSEVLGQTVAIFLDTNDAGKDGAFSGTWKQKDGEDLEGKFVIQCKFTNKADTNLALSDVADEFEKIERLVNSGRCDCYILMTNAGVSGQFEKKFNDKMTSLRVKSCRIFGSTWIFTQIHENKRLRMLVPRVYGLGDLSQILDERAYSQAKQLLSSMRDDLSKIVITKAYHKAAKALSEHGYVLIIGEPAAGKTTIASLLAVAAVDQWELFTLKLDTPELVIEHWNPDDPNQFFWIDDAFGVTQYESGLVNNWNHVLPQVRSMLKQGIKIVMTSRDYIYKRARNDLKESAFPLFNESQVVIDLNELTLTEKEEILYNHLKLGNQPSSFLLDVKPFLTDIAKHQRFIPETARRLADPVFTKQLYISKNSLLQFVEKQEFLLDEVIRGLDKHSKAALALIYMNNGQIMSPWDVKQTESDAIERLGSDVGNCIQALESMKDSLVQYIFIDDNSTWRFKHPTIGDAYARIVAKSPEQLEIYLQGTDIEKVMDQVTCGNVGLEKTIIITKSMFPLILKRILQFKESEVYKTGYLSRWSAKRKIYNFLSRRSSKDFLKLYISENPEIFEQILNPSMSFYYSAEIDLVIKLHELNLLPENYRKEFVDYIAFYTISGDDFYILKNEVLQKVFTTNELEDLKQKILTDLLPKIQDVRLRRECEFQEQNSDTAEDHMEDFFDKMDTLLEEFKGEESIIKNIEKEVMYAKNWVSDHHFDADKIPERVLNTTIENTTITTSRSIFDDIDR